MNGRFRALLDDAVSDLEPASPDPVPIIVGRGRAARRRAIGAGALAIALLAGAAVTAGVRLADHPGPVGTVAAEPPTPRVAGRTVVAGDVNVPVPDGWKVLVADRKGPCGELKDTVLVYGPGSETNSCQIASIEVAGATSINPPGRGAFDGNAMFALPPSPYTLKGGAPAWLTEAVTDETNDPKGKAAGYSYWNVLLVPWSKVRVTMRVPGAEQQRIIDSISVTPSPRAGRLALQDTVAEAELSRTGSGGAEPDHGEVTDARSIDAVLRLLRKQHETVDSRHACTSPDLPTARLTMRQVELQVPGRGQVTPSERASLAASPTTSIIISLGDCREAVSSNGGRVRMSQDTVDTLARLFGLAAR